MGYDVVVKRNMYFYHGVYNHAEFISNIVSRLK